MIIGECPAPAPDILVHVSDFKIKFFAYPVSYCTIGPVLIETAAIHPRIIPDVQENLILHSREQPFFQVFLARKWQDGPEKIPEPVCIDIAIIFQLIATDKGLANKSLLQPEPVRQAAVQKRVRIYHLLPDPVFGSIPADAADHPPAAYKPISSCKRQLFG